MYHMLLSSFICAFVGDGQQMSYSNFYDNNYSGSNISTEVNIREVEYLKTATSQSSPS